MEVYVNKLKFYGERERLSCTERQNKKLKSWLRKKNRMAAIHKREEHVRRKRREGKQNDRKKNITSNQLQKMPTCSSERS